MARPTEARVREMIAEAINGLRNEIGTIALNTFQQQAGEIAWSVGSR